MSDIPESQEHFAVGGVSLTVYHYNDPIRNFYKVRVGVGVLPMSESDLQRLTELLTAYSPPEEEARHWWQKKRRVK